MFLNFRCCCRREKLKLNLNYDPQVMIRAINEDDLTTLKRLFTQGFDIDREIAGQKNSLQIAIESGSLSVISFLVERSIKKEVKEPKTGMNLLHLAACRGDVPIFNYLFKTLPVALRYDVDYSGKNISHIATDQCNCVLLAYIIKFDCRLLKLLDNQGENCLHKAARMNSQLLVQYITKYCGISPSIQNKNGQLASDLTKDRAIQEFLDNYLRFQTESKEYQTLTTEESEDSFQKSGQIKRRRTQNKSQSFDANACKDKIANS